MGIGVMLVGIAFATGPATPGGALHVPLPAHRNLHSSLYKQHKLIHYEGSPFSRNWRMLKGPSLLLCA